jgi:hypothetical protein
MIQNFLVKLHETDFWTSMERLLLTTAQSEKQKCFDKEVLGRGEESSNK